MRARDRFDFLSIREGELQMHRRTRESHALKLRRCVALLLCSLAIGCEPDEPLDEANAMTGGGGSGGSDAGAAVSASDAAGSAAANDAGVVAPGNAGGGNADGGNAGGGTNAGGGNAGGGNADGGRGGADASGPSSDLDAGIDWSNRDASTGGVVVGPSMRRDGGPARWDPDAAGPILNPQTQAACLSLTDNICNRVVECQESLGEALTAAQRKARLESCRATIWLKHNCNRAIRTTSDFATCSESTKTVDCGQVFATDVGASCLDKITFQP
jgi:hypothetical protein